MPSSDSERISGQFWLADAPDRTVGGWIDLGSRWPRLDVAESLTSAFQEVDRTQQSGGEVTIWEPADDDVDPTTATVHGLLRRGPFRRVTLLDAHNTGREQLWGLTIDDPGTEQLEAGIGLLGSTHVDADTRFSAAKLRLRHLDVWAHMPGLEVNEDGTETVIRSARPEPLTIEMTTPAGQLVLELNLPMVDLSVRGATLRRNATLRFQSDGDGLTVQDLWAQLVRPLSILLSLALDVDCPPVRLEVQTPDGHWLQVLHPLISRQTTSNHRAECCYGVSNCTWRCWGTGCQRSRP